MASINYVTLKDVLLELNPDLIFDDGQMFEYFGVTKGHRVGIEFNGEHITNCDTGDIPEDQVQHVVEVPTIIDPDERDHFKTSTRKWTVFEGHPFFDEIHPQMGNRTRASVYVGTYPAIAERGELIHPTRNRPETSITIYTYWEPRGQKQDIIQIGWRKVLSLIVKADIPGVTREALEDKLSIALRDEG